MAPPRAARRGRVSRQREPSSDAIEEDGPSQTALADDTQNIADFEDEEQVPRSKKTMKSSKSAKEKKKGKASADIDIEELQSLGDQPIDKTQASKISGMSEDWARMISTIHNNSYALARDVAATAAEFTDGEQGVSILSHLDSVMKSLVDTENELRAHERALNDLHQKLVQEEQVTGIVDAYDSGVLRHKQEYKAMTSRRKYGKNEEYTNFRQAIHEVQHPEDPMPPVSELIEREDGDDSDDEDEVVVGGVTQDYKCPLTLVLMVDPLTSKSCGHSFSADAIREYLGNSTTISKKCPTAGCDKVLSMKGLFPNKELAKKAKETARRERMREEEEQPDDDMIID